MSYLGHSLRALTNTIDLQFVDAETYRPGLRIERRGVIIIHQGEYYISKDTGVPYPFNCSYWSTDEPYFRQLSASPKVYGTLSEYAMDDIKVSGVFSKDRYETPIAPATPLKPSGFTWGGFGAILIVEAGARGQASQTLVIIDSVTNSARLGTVWRRNTEGGPRSWSQWTQDLTSNHLWKVFSQNDQSGDPPYIAVGRTETSYTAAATYNGIQKSGYGIPYFAAGLNKTYTRAWKSLEPSPDIGRKYTNQLDTPVKISFLTKIGSGTRILEVNHYSVDGDMVPVLRSTVISTESATYELDINPGEGFSIAPGSVYELALMYAPKITTPVFA